MNVSSAADTPHTPRCLTGADMPCPHRYSLAADTIAWHQATGYTRNGWLSGSVTMHFCFQVGRTNANGGDGATLLNAEINYNALEAQHAEQGLPSAHR